MELKRHRICIDQYRGSPQWVDGRNSQNFPAAPEARSICRTTPNKIFKLHSGRPIPLIFGDIQSANDIARMRPRLRRYNNLLGMTFLRRGRSDGAACSRLGGIISRRFMQGLTFCDFSGWRMVLVPSHWAGKLPTRTGGSPVPPGIVGRVASANRTVQGRPD